MNIAEEAASVVVRGIPLAEAIDFLKERLALPEALWQSLVREADRAARTRAAGMSEAMYRDLIAEILKSLETGTSYADFKAGFDAIGLRHGWKGEDEAGWRSKLIFRTMTAQAQAAGAWRQIQRAKALRPWLRYVAIEDSRVRDEHRHWHGTVLAVDDPWWDTHFPPNGFHCRCAVRQLNDRDLVRHGYTVSAAAPDINLVPQLVTIDGVTQYQMVPKGIHPGFAFNAGKVGLGLPRVER